MRLGKASLRRCFTYGVMMILLATGCQTTQPKPQASAPATGGPNATATIAADDAERAKQKLEADKAKKDRNTPPPPTMENQRGRGVVNQPVGGRP